MDPREQADEIILAGAIFFSGSEYRVDQVVANAGLALLDLEAVGEEVEQFAFADPKPQAAFRHDVDDAQTGPAERARVFRTGRLLADRANAAARIPLIRQRHGHRSRRGGTPAERRGGQGCGRTCRSRWYPYC